MNFSTLLIIIEVMVLQLQYCEHVTAEVDWTTAYEHCRLQDDSIADLQDVQNNVSLLNEFDQIWSPVKGQFTPWIAYRGCFGGSVCGSLTTENFTNKDCHSLKNNTAGNCYFECKSKQYANGGCASISNFFFGLQESICLCMCDNTIIKYISESKKCNISCKTSIKNGECGGNGFFSVYESTNFMLPDKHYGGFCLTCRAQNDFSKTLLYSIDCKENSTGHCVESNGSASSLPPIISTFASYWKYCWNHNKYIVGDTSQSFCKGDISIWTGLRKYKIDNSNIDNDSCFIVEIQNGTVNYKEKKCTEHHFFLCKREFNQKDFSSAKYIRSSTYTTPPTLTRETSISYNSRSTRGNTSHFTASTYSPSSKSEASTSIDGISTWTTKMFSSKTPFTFSLTSLKTSFSADTSPIITTSISPSSKEANKTAVIGSCIAGVVLISVVFLTICLLKRRKLPCMQSKQQQAKIAKGFYNTTYDDLVVTNQKPDVNYANTTLESGNQGSICKIDDIYVEKEEEYDHLGTSRQKKMTTKVDDDRYGSASYFEEDSYSTLRQNKTAEQYSVNIMHYSKNQPGSVKTPEYDYCYQSNKRKDW